MGSYKWSYKSTSTVRARAWRLRGSDGVLGLEVRVLGQGPGFRVVSAYGSSSTLYLSLLVDSTTQDFEHDHLFMLLLCSC